MSGESDDDVDLQFLADQIKVFDSMPLPNEAPRFSQDQVKRAIDEAVARERDRYRTETIEGKLTALSEKVDTNHKDVVKRLDEANHVREFLTERLDKTDKKIDEGFQKQTQDLAQHMSSPQHQLMTEHIATPHFFTALKNVGPDELAELGPVLQEAKKRRDASVRHRILAQNVSINAGSAYAILASCMLIGSGIVFLLQHIVIH